MPQELIRNGYRLVGEELCRQVLAHEHNAEVADRIKKALPRSARVVFRVSSEGIQFDPLDARSKEALDRVLALKGIA